MKIPPNRTVVFALMLMAGFAHTAAAQVFVRQFGTADDDFAFGAAADATGAYVGGYQNDSDIAPLSPCRTGAESLAVQAFVRKYTNSGTLDGGFNASPTATEIARAVASDAGGSVYEVGEIVLNGNAFVRKYDSSGVPVWTSAIAASGPFDIDIAYGVAVDPTGDVYVIGSTQGTLPGQTSAGGTDSFIIKYNSTTGAVLWTRQFGTASADVARSVAADPSGVYVAGYTSGSLGQTSAGIDDAFVRKYDSLGAAQWTRQFGTSVADFALGIAVAPTGIYVSGYTSGVLAGSTGLGLEDGFLRKYNTSGVAQWTRQFGTSSADFAVGVAADATNVYVAGYTGGLLGAAAFGGADAFVRSHDANGKLLWTKQFGTNSEDAAWAASPDGAGVYAAGCTTGTFAGESNAGRSDAFLAKLANPTPDPEISITIDIKPGAFPNTINVGANGTVPVAILSSVTFAATTVDPVSVTLAGASVALKGKSNSALASINDVNGDGRLDLLVHVDTEALVLSNTDTAAILKGQTFSGQPITGTDFVRVIQ